MDPPASTTEPALNSSNTCGLEILRRVLFLGGILLSAWLFCSTGGSLWRLRPARFGSDRDASEVNDDPTLIAQETKDRLIRVSGPAWTHLLNEISATFAGKSPGLRTHLSTDTSTSYLFFPAATAPLTELSPRLGPVNPFSYLALTENGRDRYFEVVTLPPKDARRYAPSAFVYPGRKITGWILLGSILAYWLLPWPRYGPRTLSYSRPRAIVVPDVMGAVLTCLFFTLPILIVGDNYSGASTDGLFDFDSGWIWLTGIMWFMALFGISITLTALWYAVFRLDVRDDGFQVQTFFTHRDCSYAEITQAGLAVWSLPGWLKWTMLIAGLLNWRLLGAVMLGATRENRGIAIHPQTGPAFNLWMDCLDGRSHFHQALLDHRVPLTPALAQDLAQWSEDCPQPEPWPNAAPRRSIPGTILVLLSTALICYFQLRPAPMPEIRRASRAMTTAAIQRRSELLKEMSTLKPQMDEALEHHDLDRFQQLTDRHQQLCDEFDELIKD